MISQGNNSLYPISHLGQSVFAFVDADNFKRSLERALKSLGIEEQHFPKFPVINLLTSTPISRFYVYSAVEQGKDAQEWIAEIRSQSKFIFRQSLLTTSGRQKKQEGVDVLLALEAIKCAYKKTMDACAIFSDDGDLLPLTNALVEEGIMTAVVSFGNPSKSDVASRLRDAADEYYQIGHDILRSVYSHCFLNSQSTVAGRGLPSNMGATIEKEFGADSYLQFVEQSGGVRCAKYNEDQLNWQIKLFASEEDAEIYFVLNSGWRF